MDADERRWRTVGCFYLRTSASSADSSSVRTPRINVRSARAPIIRRWAQMYADGESLAALSAYICVICGFVPRHEHPASTFVYCETRSSADGRRCTQMENLWLLLSAYICVICGFVLGTNTPHQRSFSARPDHPQIDADERR